MISRNGKGGRQVLFVAGGGGGGGARDGQPGSGLDGELPGTRIDKRNGRAGTQTAGGAAGDSGEAALCAFPSRPGSRWQGGAGAQFGGGGGGGVFGGGGGGTSPGIAGGGGGGSSFADTTVCRDVVILQGVENFPGGMKHAPPKACGVGDWDFVLTQRLFLTFSELQVRVDGVYALTNRLDVVDVAVRESTRLAREPRQFRDSVVPHRLEAWPGRAAGPTSWNARRARTAP